MSPSSRASTGKLRVKIPEIPINWQEGRGKDPPKNVKIGVDGIQGTMLDQRSGVQLLLE